MDVDARLIKAAEEELQRRFPDAGGIAAAGYLRSGRLVVGVMFVPEWGGGGLCAETEVILEANRTTDPLEAIVCVSRLDGAGTIHVIPPCGICQERLFHWGGSIRVGISDSGLVTGWRSVALDSLQPHHWVNVLRATGST